MPYSWNFCTGFSNRCLIVSTPNPAIPNVARSYPPPPRQRPSSFGTGPPAASHVPPLLPLPSAPPIEDEPRDERPPERNPPPPRPAQAAEPFNQQVALHDGYNSQVQFGNAADDWVHGFPPPQGDGAYIDPGPVGFDPGDPYDYGNMAVATAGPMTWGGPAQQQQQSFGRMAHPEMYSNPLLDPGLQV